MAKRCRSPAGSMSVTRPATSRVRSRFSVRVRDRGYGARRYVFRCFWGPAVHNLLTIEQGVADGRLLLRYRHLKQGVDASWLGESKSLGPQSAKRTVDFQSPERLSDNRTMSYGSL